MGTKADNGDLCGVGGPDVNNRLDIPPHGRGARIGLLGGSFNPPHAAHRAISLYAMKRLRLDHVWWLVSPGNPLKRNDALPPISRRIEAAERLAAHPQIRVSGLEAAIGTRYTDDTVAILQRCCPDARFVWIMGADNLVQFHRWRNWRTLASRLPIAIIDRPPATLRALSSPAALSLARYRRRESGAARLAGSRPPAWVFLHGIKLPLSSTELRKAGRGLAD